MSGLKQLQDSVGVKVTGGSGCGAKYGGKKCGAKYGGTRSTLMGGKKGKRSTKKARKTKKSKISGRRKTSKKSFLARLFKL